MSQPIQRICMVRLSALGDVCLALPLVRTLQRALPNAEITWLISRPMHELLSGLDGVEFVVIEKKRYIREWLRVASILRGRKFDVLLAAQASFRANFFYPVIRAPVKVGFDANRSRDFHWGFVTHRLAPRREHLLDGFLAFASAIGIRDRVLEWNLPLTEADQEFAANVLRDGERWLAINPAASRTERNWLADRYAAVIDHAIEKWNCRIVLTGGPGAAERKLSEAVLAQAKHRSAIVDLVGRTAPKQLAAVLARVECLVAPDTGPVHIATAVGTPVIGLYAVAPPELSGPYLSQHLVVNRFPQAVRRFIGAEPQSVPWGTRVKTQQAMELIHVADVLEKLDQVLAREPDRVPR